MYAHAQVWDAVEGKMVDVGNNVREVIARDPKRYSLSKPEPEAPATFTAKPVLVEKGEG